MDEVEEIYLAAWRNVNQEQFQITGTCAAFESFLNDEEEAIAIELKGLKGNGAKSEVDQVRWRVRLALTRAANYLINHWHGRCKVCGCETHASNASGPTRTLCDDCAFKDVPTPSPSELWEEVGNAFPTTTIQPSTFTNMTVQNRRVVQAWLTSVIVDKKILPTPPIMAPYSKMLGITVNGRDLWTKHEEAEES